MQSDPHGELESICKISAADSCPHGNQHDDVTKRRLHHRHYSNRFITSYTTTMTSLRRHELHWWWKHTKHWNIRNAPM